ncbi:MAG TPA: hemerythrin domain-containing protein [Acidimicrobiales bacterium]|nr:hemerythrin domain-containing protein [Acidimicrobiales bacterium]
MNLIDELLEDHATVRRLFTEIAAAPVERREELFDSLREELIRHEVAEEEIVRPLTKQSVPGGEHIASERIAEESEAEKVLKEMEKSEVGTPAWEQLFETLRLSVLEHAEREESTEFPRLQAHLTASELAEKGKTFASAKQMAPTHPHPGTPNTPGANKMLGPVAALMDRARDAVARAKSA